MILAKACLGTLLRLDDRISRHNVGYKLPLARYAAEYWVKHAQCDGVLSIIREEMEILLIRMDHIFLRAFESTASTSSPTIVTSTLGYFAPNEKSDASPLYYAALCAFYHFAEHLLPTTSERLSGFYGTLQGRTVTLSTRRGHRRSGTSQANSDVWRIMHRTPRNHSTVTRPRRLGF